MHRPDTRLRILLLGREPKQQLRSSQALLAWAVYLLFAGGQCWLARRGLVDASAAGLESLFAVGGSSVFFLLVRSRVLARRCADPNLAMPQMLWALACTSWAYAINGPVRGGVLLLMMLIIQFGTFSLNRAHSRQILLAGFGLLSGAMVWKCLTDPDRYDPVVEGVHFASAAVVLYAVALLARRFGKMRAQLQAQRRELGQALERIQALATRDELTGLTNRRAVLERMRSEVARPGPPMSVALIDIDHFKAVNDGHGHAAGDAVLRRFAQRGSTVVRTGDVLARWGGEEFLLVMPATAAADLLSALARLRELLHAESLDDIAPGLRVGFSAGVAECMGVDDIEDAIERADTAMYEAKRAGRDRSLLSTGRAAHAVSAIRADAPLSAVPSETARVLAA